MPSLIPIFFLLLHLQLTGRDFSIVDSILFDFFPSPFYEEKKKEKRNDAKALLPDPIQILHVVFSFFLFLSFYIS